MNSFAACWTTRFSQHPQLAWERIVMKVHGVPIEAAAVLMKLAALGLGATKVFAGASEAGQTPSQ
jgi:hypothetical protein